jgi:hypothetical protein
MFFSLMDGNLRSHIKGRAVIPGDLGSGDMGKVRAYNGQAFADWRKLFNENTVNSALPDKKLPNKINLIKVKTNICVISHAKLNWNITKIKKKAVSRGLKISFSNIYHPTLVKNLIIWSKFENKDVYENWL